MPWAEMFVTSASEVLMPSGSKLILIFPHNRFCFLQLITRQSIVPSEFNLRFQPKYGFTIRADNVNMQPCLLS